MKYKDGQEYITEQICSWGKLPFPLRASCDTSQQAETHKASREKWKGANKEILFSERVSLFAINYFHYNGKIFSPNNFNK